MVAVVACASNLQADGFNRRRAASCEALAPTRRPGGLRQTFARRRCERVALTADIDDSGGVTDGRANITQRFQLCSGSLRRRHLNRRATTTVAVSSPASTPSAPTSSASISATPASSCSWRLSVFIIAGVFSPRSQHGRALAIRSPSRHRHLVSKNAAILTRSLQISRDRIIEVPDPIIANRRCRIRVAGAAPISAMFLIPCCFSCIDLSFTELLNVEVSRNQLSRVPNFHTSLCIRVIGRIFHAPEWTSKVRRGDTAIVCAVLRQSFPSDRCEISAVTIGRQRRSRRHHPAQTADVFGGQPLDFIWERLEPLSACADVPSTGRASMQLRQAIAYRSF